MTEPLAEELGAAPTTRAAALRSAFGSEATFARFYDEALPRVYSYLMSRCGDQATAEELTQDTFVTAVRERFRFDGRSDPMTWLIGIARHRLADHFRRREAEERRHLRLLVREVSMEPDAVAWRSADDRAEIARTLARLPSAQRAVLILHYADGLSVREVAAHLGKSESAVESLMTRAREGFRAAYRGVQ